MNIALSILDQAPVGFGSTPADALRASVEVAREADRLGYTRYWMAEHHNSPSLACAAPEMVVARILHGTSQIRVGTGGVLLPRYRPEKVAEAFAVLTAFDPERVDLGVGRAGGDPSNFPQDLFALERLLDDESHRHGTSAQLWLLGASESSARFAAANGLRYTFGQFLLPASATVPSRVYGEAFRGNGDSRRFLPAVRVIAASTDHDARVLAERVLLWRCRKDLGRDLPVPTSGQALAHVWTDRERRARIGREDAMVIGTFDDVASQLVRYAEHHDVTEVMINVPIPEVSVRTAMLGNLADAVIAVTAAGTDRHQNQQASAS